MPTLGFIDVGIKSEHRSLQRHLASLLPNKQIERKYREGVLLERPFAILSALRIDGTPHSTYAAFPETDYLFTYYAADFEDAEAAMESLASLGYRNNRAPLWDYDTDPENPVRLTDYMLRIRDVHVERNPDTEDDRLFNIVASMNVEGKRSLDKYSGETLTDITIAVQP